MEIVRSMAGNGAHSCAPIRRAAGGPGGGQLRWSGGPQCRAQFSQPVTAAESSGLPWQRPRAWPAWYHRLLPRRASPQASLYLTPYTGSPGVGDELDVQIRVNTGSQFTNAVQANFTYPSSQLTVLGFDNSTSSFPVVAQQQASNGLIQVAGGAFTPVSGDANLTTVRFQVIGTGTAQVCPAGQSLIVSSSTHQAIPSTMSGATFVAGSPSAFGVGCIVHDWIAQGAKHAITIHGEGFNTGGATVTVSGTGVKTSGTTVMSGTKLTTTITVPATAATGFRDVTVTSGGQTHLCEKLPDHR